MARALAESTGQSVTAAIKTALEAQIEQRDADVQSKLAWLDASSADFRKNMPPEWHGQTSKKIMGSIYNAVGAFAA